MLYTWPLHSFPRYFEVILKYLRNLEFLPLDPRVQISNVGNVLIFLFLFLKCFTNGPFCSQFLSFSSNSSQMALTMLPKAFKVIFKSLQFFLIYTLWLHTTKNNILVDLKNKHNFFNFLKFFRNGSRIVFPRLLKWPWKPSKKLIILPLNLRVQISTFW